MKNLESMISSLMSNQTISNEEAAEIDRMERAARRRDEMGRIVASGIPKRFIGIDPRLAPNEARKYIANFSMESKLGKGLFIAGSKGSGKTRAASVIAEQIVKQRISVKFSTVPDLFGEIQSTYSTNENGERIFQSYTQAKLLILDDLGKECPSEWAITMLFRIVNARYESLKPLIVTTQSNEDGLLRRLSKSGNRDTAEAIMSRLNEMCRKVELKGGDRRI